VNIKATFYSSFTRILYFFVYPFVKFLDRTVTYPSLLVYNILRCEGYSKELAIAIVRQSQLESGNYTSSLFKNANNLFGMKKPRIRKTLSNEGSYLLPEGEFATFDTLAESVLDRVLWDQYFKINIDLSVLDYLVEVQSKGYAEDPNYIKKVLSVSPLLDFRLSIFVTAFYAGFALISILIARSRAN
jgi:hypothetical protein